MAAIEFYEKVEVLDCSRFPDRVGKFGYVLGKSYVDDDLTGEVCSFGVFFEDAGKVYAFAPQEIAGTGEVADRSRFYPD